MYKYSTEKDDYKKCQKCSKVGILTMIPCICNKIEYCSQECMDKDKTHQDDCPEIKKRLLNPYFINF